MEVILIPVALFLLIVLTCAYFLPSFFAWRRKHPYGVPILIVNLLFGWTLIGWVGALAWSFSGD